MLNNDQKITVGCALTIGAWIITFAALLAVWATDDVRLGFTMILILGIAACLTVREVIVGHRDRLWNAFRLGKDAAEPTRLRR